jgi:hypothetical protein
MTVFQRGQPRQTAHPDEWLSIVVALGGTAIAAAFLWTAPQFEPKSGALWALTVWCGFAYLLVQMIFLLLSATQIRAVGVLDSVISIAPVVAAVVIAIEWIMGRVPLSDYQINTLLVLLIAGAAEFLLTIWIRFVINRRTIAFADSDGNF